MALPDMYIMGAEGKVRLHHHDLQHTMIDTLRYKQHLSLEETLIEALLTPIKTTAPTYIARLQEDGDHIISDLRSEITGYGSSPLFPCIPQPSLQPRIPMQIGTSPASPVPHPLSGIPSTPLEATWPAEDRTVMYGMHSNRQLHLHHALPTVFRFSLSCSVIFSNHLNLCNDQTLTAGDEDPGLSHPLLLLFFCIRATSLRSRQATARFHRRCGTRQGLHDRHEFRSAPQSHLRQEKGASRTEGGYHRFRSWPPRLSSDADTSATVPRS